MFGERCLNKFRMNQSVIIAPVQESLLNFISSTNYSKVIVIADNNTKKHCYPLIKSVLPKHKLIEIVSGESNKTLQTCGKIWEAMTIEELDRHALVINVGGGVIGDMGGFVQPFIKEELISYKFQPRCYLRLMQALGEN